VTSLARPLRKLILNQSKKHAFSGHHPWILEHSLHLPASQPELGEIVELVREDGKFIGSGFYNPNSRIRVRLLTWKSDERIDDDFFRRRIDRAISLRTQFCPSANNQSMRLVFSEADQLSGLIVDKFGEHLVIQVNSLGILPFIDTIAQRLFEIYRPLSIVQMIDDKSAKSEGMEPGTTTLMGSVPQEPIELEENGLLWKIDLAHGQKTGYYLDQRDNRLAAARWTPRDARVLDVCTYLGGFALTIAKHATTSSITAIDSSERALQAALANAERNGLQDRVEFVQADFMDYLSNELDLGARFDMIVLDPPRLASSRDNMRRAMAAYHRINYLAIRMLVPGGVLVTCSCSGRVTRGDFRDMLRGVAERAGREVQLLEERGAPADHPVSLNCPESDYLKCTIARVL
jgi:23S rRNA (cytosine1962-C5)-methyltransferase